MSKEVATIILAGGQGTRLYPLTAHHSKPAITYGGRYRLIDIPISNSLNSKFRQIFVLAQYLSDDLKEHIDKTYKSITVLTPKEGQFEGTADAVRKNLTTFLQCKAEYFLILSGDQLYNLNFQEMVHFAIEKKADLTIAALPVLETEAKRMGLLRIDDAGAVLAFAEKPQPDVMKEFLLPTTFYKTWHLEQRHEPSYLGSMGIYLFKRDFLSSLLAKGGNDFGYDLISMAVKKRRQPLLSFRATGKISAPSPPITRRIYS